MPDTRLRRNNETPVPYDRDDDGNIIYTQNADGTAGGVYTYNAHRQGELPPPSDAPPAANDFDDAAIAALAAAATLAAARQGKAAQDQREAAAAHPNTEEARYHLAQEQEHLTAQNAYQQQARVANAGGPRAAIAPVSPVKEEIHATVSNPEQPGTPEAAAAQERLEHLKQNKPDLVASMGEAAIYEPAAYEDYTEQSLFYSEEAAGDPAETPHEGAEVASGSLDYGNHVNDPEASEAEILEAHHEHLRSLGDAQMARARYTQLQGKIAELRAKGLPTGAVEAQAGWALQREARAYGLASHAERIEDGQRWNLRLEQGARETQRMQEAAGRTHDPDGVPDQTPQAHEDNGIMPAAAATASVLATGAGATHARRRAEPERSAAPAADRIAPIEEPRDTHTPDASEAFEAAEAQAVIHTAAASDHAVYTPSADRGPPDTHEAAVAAAKAGPVTAAETPRAAPRVRKVSATAPRPVNETPAPRPPGVPGEPMGAPINVASVRTPTPVQRANAQGSQDQPQAAPQQQARATQPARPQREEPEHAAIPAPQAMVAMDAAEADMNDDGTEPGGPIDQAQRGVVQPAALPPNVRAETGEGGMTTYIFVAPPEAVALGFEASVVLGTDDGSGHGGGVADQAWALSAQMDAAIAQAREEAENASRAPGPDADWYPPDIFVLADHIPASPEDRRHKVEEKVNETINEIRDNVIQREVQPGTIWDRGDDIIEQSHKDDELLVYKGPMPGDFAREQEEAMKQRHAMEAEARQKQAPKPEEPKTPEPD